MRLFSWLQERITGRPRARRAPARGPALRFRPHLESLEERLVPSFTPVTPYAMGTAPHAVVTADVNGDGKPDLVTLSNSFGVSAITVRLNKGNGKFGSPQVSYDFVNNIDTALAVGDVNGDGKADLVLGQASNGGSYTAGTYIGSISVLLGNGTGHFTYASTYYVLQDVSNITSLALADVNGDGRLDVVGAAGGRVFATLNDGSGRDWAPAHTYSDPTAQAAGGLSLQVAVGDITGDGKLDIVAAGYGTVCVYQNLGGGTFGTAQTYAAGGSATSVALGDFNGDGKLDVVTANTNGTVSVLAGQGNGTFGAVQNHAIGGPASSVALGDFNHDGKIDIVTTGGTEMDVLLNTGSGAFAAYQKVGSAGSSIVAADFNGDGYADLAEVATSTSIDVLLNNAKW